MRDGASKQATLRGLLPARAGKGRLGGVMMSSYGTFLQDVGIAIKH